MVKAPKNKTEKIEKKEGDTKVDFVFPKKEWDQALREYVKKKKKSWKDDIDKSNPSYRKKWPPGN